MNDLNRTERNHINEKSTLSNRFLFICLSWVAIAAVSDLPDLLWKSLFKTIPEWLFWSKISFIAVFYILTRAWKRIRPLGDFALIMTVFLFTFGLTSLIRKTAWWQGIFPPNSRSFYLGYLGLYILDLALAFIVIAGLFAIKGKRKSFFFVKGDIQAPIRPVKWMGIRSGESWKKFGIIFAVVAGAGVFFPTVLSIKPSGNDLIKALPLIPGVILFSLINSFTEEVYYRLTILSTLPGLTGKTHAQLINIFFFGMAHYLYGSPSGLIGFMMTGFLAWLLGKSILETRGFAWAWFMHFVPDVVIFFSYALLWFRNT